MPVVTIPLVSVVENVDAFSWHSRHPGKGICA